MVLPGTCHPVLGFHMTSVGQCSLERSWLWESRRLSLSFTSLVFFLKKADEIASRLMWSWNPPNVAVGTRMASRILCGGHEVSSFRGTVESSRHVAEDLVSATSVPLTRNTAFHPTLFYAELFGNKPHLRSAVLLSTSWKTKMLRKVFRIAFTSLYTLPVYCSQSFSENGFATISRMLMLARSFSMMTTLMSLLDYSSVKVTFCSWMFPRS